MVLISEYSPEYFWDILQKSDAHHVGVNLGQSRVWGFLLIVNDRRRTLDSIFVATITTIITMIIFEMLPSM